MKTVLILLFFILLVSMVSAQQVMMVEKAGSKKHYFFREDDRIKIRIKKPDTLFVGKLWDIQTDRIVVQSWRYHQVDLQNINAVYKKFYFPSKIAPWAAIAGTTMFAIIGINHLINNEPFFSADMLYVSGSLFAVSGLCYTLQEKRCRIGNRWTIKILDYSFGKDSK